MGIGGGLAAVGGFYQGQAELKDAEFLAKQRAVQIANAQAGLDSLPARTKAEITGAELSTARNTAGMQTIQPETDNAVRAARLRGAGLEFEAQSLPGKQQIAAAEQEFQINNLPKTQALAKAGLDRAVAKVPILDAQQAAEGVNSWNDQNSREMLMMAQHLAANDKNSALTLANKIAAGKKNYVDLQATGEKGTSGDTRGFDLIASDGSKYNIPFSALSGAMPRGKPGKYSMKQGSAGDVHVLNEETGQLETKVQADPNYGSKPGNNQNTPAELQIIRAIMAAPENKDMTFSQAMARVKTSMEKPRHEAILDLVGKTINPGGDPQKEYDRWADLYDRAKGGGSPSSANPGKPELGIGQKFLNLFTP